MSKETVKPDNRKVIEKTKRKKWDWNNLEIEKKLETDKDSNEQGKQMKDNQNKLGHAQKKLREKHEREYTKQ